MINKMLYFMYNSIQVTVVVHYRAVKLHKIVYEAMMRLAWKGFLLWIHVNHGAEVHHLEEALESISTFHDGLFQTSFTAPTDDVSCLHSHVASVPRVSWHHRE